MPKITLFFAAFCILTIASCKKKENDPNRKDLLTNGKWRVAASWTYETTGSTTDTTNNYLSTPDCEKDDLSIFQTDNHLITDEGPTKCTASNPQQSDLGTWSLIENDSKLYFVGTGFIVTYKINTLTSSTFEIEYSDTLASTITRQVATLSHVD